MQKYGPEHFGGCEGLRTEAVHQVGGVEIDELKPQNEEPLKVFLFQNQLFQLIMVKSPPLIRLRFCFAEESLERDGMIRLEGRPNRKRVFPLFYCGVVPQSSKPINQTVLRFLPPR